MEAPFKTVLDEVPYSFENVLDEVPYSFKNVLDEHCVEGTTTLLTPLYTLSRPSSLIGKRLA